MAKNNIVTFVVNDDDLNDIDELLVSDKQYESRSDLIRKTVMPVVRKQLGKLKKEKKGK